ncbi:SDR family NAD(P)-dependent oxidoreductase [Parahaliea aestuarii]|uniref:SDR family oxidoreductase n=1 Tax=Parahaliea aestuarii TaxID=1852021 RepID=A0A5C9A5N8_9GAMM|nr:SDR family NAD(P)-dependent oxidoreductase [Parahaliea aestuarii]TXS95070.1 SDR family oxidoreductase [Parahaliea aestuarii]
MKLTNKVALITGATGGIGLAAAKLFVGEGARVMLADIDQAALEAAVAELGAEQAASVVVDVTQPEQAERAVASTVEHFGQLDIYVANAGIVGPIQSIEDCPVEAFDKVLAVNVRGVWLGIKYAMPAMRRQGGGSIVITSSGAGVQGMPNMSPYNTSKHAVIGTMRCAAKEGAADNIRVNTVNPGPVATRMIESIESGFDKDNTDQVREAFTAGVPMGRYGTPEEVAKLMLFLASDDSSYCTGGVYMVDGGNAA